MTIDPFSFKTHPFLHQADELLVSAELPSRAIFWEQGTGKTKLAIDTTAHLWRTNKIEGAVIVAPPGVERNWITDEIPAHLADDIPHRAMVYRSASASTKWHKAALEELLLKEPQLAILAITYDAWMTESGKQAVWDMLRSRPTILHIDESAHIKTPSSARATSVIKGSPFAKYRRVYSGTPVDNSPFDVYSQMLAVDPEFWRRELGLPNLTAFKAFFGIWDRKTRRGKRMKDGQVSEPFEYPVLVAYQNLDLLRSTLQRLSSRVLKDDVLDLPPKLYTKRYYELSPAQRRVYDALEKEYWADLPDDPEALITAPLAIVRMTRLQQVLCGYVPADGDEEPRHLIDPAHNPRLDATVQFVCEQGLNKAIVWAQYRMDVDLLIARLRAEGRRPVRYDGALDEDERERSKNEFKKGDATDFVGNPAVGAEGLTLTEAHTVAFHNNSYRMLKRKQAEDRAHRIGLQHAVLYGDMVCSGSRDEHAIRALQHKHRVSEHVLGDREREWLT